MTAINSAMPKDPAVYAVRTADLLMLPILLLVPIVYVQLGWMQPSILQRDGMSAMLLQVFCLAAFTAAPCTADRPPAYPAPSDNWIEALLPGVVISVALLIAGGVHNVQPISLPIAGVGLYAALTMLWIRASAIAAHSMRTAFIVLLLCCLAIGISPALLNHFNVYSLESLVYACAAVFALTGWALGKLGGPGRRSPSVAAHTAASIGDASPVYSLPELLFWLGLYAPHGIISYSELGIVAGIHRYAPTYDLAACIALCVNLPMMYLYFCHWAQPAHGRTSVVQEYIMAATPQPNLRAHLQVLWHCVGVQMAVTACVSPLLLIGLPMLGLGGSVLNAYPALAIAYLVVFTFRLLLSLLQRIGDRTGMRGAAAAFAIASCVGAALSVRWLPTHFYGMGLLTGALIGLCVACVRLSPYGRLR